MPNRSLRALYMGLPLFACGCHAAVAWCVGTAPPLGNISPTISCSLLLSQEQKVKERNEEKDWQRETRKGQRSGDKETVESKGQRRIWRGNAEWVTARPTVAFVNNQLVNKGEREKAKKALGYWIFSLIRENSMSFAINQAEIFNYKTNYEVVNVSHLTQPTSKQNRTF